MEDGGDIMYNMRREMDREKELEKLRNTKREKRRRQEIDERNNFKEETEFTPITEDKGVEKRMISMGLGEHPERGFIIECHLEGRLLDGTIFFNSIKDNNNLTSPLSIHVGRRDVVKGLEIGISTMKPNEVSEFKLTALYAYGEKGYNNVLPNSEVIIKVDIRNVKEPDIQPMNMSMKQRVDKSNRLKKQGIQDFKDDEYKDAIKKFEAAYNLLTFLDDDEEFSDENTDRIVNLLCNIGNCYNKMEKWDETIKSLKFAVEIKPKHAKSYFIRGVSIT